MKGSNDLTQGSVVKHIIRYGWPFLLSNLFSELLGLTNSMLVGRYVSLEALSAVSACGVICTTFSNAFHGLGMGAGIIIARYYGAKDQKKLKQALDTAIIFAIISSIILTIASEAFLPTLMKWCNIGPEIYDLALRYLRIYLLGNTAVLTYEMCFFIMRSFGDSKHPLYYMIVCSIINISLGAILVRGFNLSVEGTAIASIVSQFVVDILSLRLLFNYDESLRFDFKKISFSFSVVKDICKLGIPTGFQNMLLSVGSMLVQSYVNLFPNEVIAAVSISDRVSGWAQLPSWTLSSVTISMVCQNAGAKDYDRVKSCVRTSMLITSILAIFTTGFVMIFAPQLLSIFSDNKEAIDIAISMTRILAISNYIVGFSHIYNAAVRASGNVTVPMIIAVCTQVILKYLFIRIGLNFSFTKEVLCWGYFVGYASAGVVASLYFFLSKYCKENHLR